MLHFILKIIGHTSTSAITSKKIVEKAEKNSVIFNSKDLKESKDMISESDLDDLF